MWANSDDIMINVQAIITKISTYHYRQDSHKSIGYNHADLPSAYQPEHI